MKESLAEMRNENNNPSQEFGGRGPHGLGDPDDKRLRKVEKDILIKQKVRKVAQERCRDEIFNFVTCAGKAGLASVISCRTENIKQLECLSKWFYDKDLNEQMKEEYLNERSNFRRTGIRRVPKARGQ